MKYSALHRRIEHARLLAAVSMLVTCSLALAGERESELLAVLQASDSSDREKALACEELASIGGVASVQPLTDLLSDPKFAHYARYALQTNPQAGDALRGGLERLNGDHLIGLVNTLAARRDQQAAGKLGELLLSANPEVAAAAAGALATFGTPECLHAVLRASDSARDTLDDALLQAGYALADQDKYEEAHALFDRVRGSSSPTHVRHAATLGMLSVSSSSQARDLILELLTAAEPWKFDAGLQGACQMSNEEGTSLLAAVFDDSETDRKKRILGALARQGGDGSLPTVRKAAVSADVRREAIVALGKLGDSSDVANLLAVALDKQSPFQETARDALVAISSRRLSEDLISMLSASSQEERLLAADVLGRRREVVAALALQEIARTSESRQMRLAALVAIKRIGPAELMLPLLDHAASDIEPEERQLAEEAALAAALKAPDRELATDMLAARILTHPPDERRLLFQALMSVGGPAALEIVSEAATGGERELQDHATRVLGAWQTADAAPVLLRVASSDNPFRVRALRGYLRIARQLNVNLVQKVAMCREALDLVERPSERRLVLEVLARTPTLDSLSLADSVLETHPSEAATTAVVSLAEQVKQAYPEQAREAARHVADNDPSRQLLERAQSILGGAHTGEGE